MKGYIKEHYQYLIKNSKYEGADLLRCFAVLGVLFFHFNITSFNRIFRLGWTGVDLFFVLSGFLIGGSIIDEYKRGNKFSFSKFYKNRALRIYPIYVLATLLTAYFNITILKLTTFNFTDAIKQLIINIFFLQTYIPYIFRKATIVNYYYIAGGTWSLVIEYFFYLVSPFIVTGLLKMTKKDLKKVFKYLFLIYLSAILIRIFMNYLTSNDPNWYYGHSVMAHCRYDELIAGVMIALIIRTFSISKGLKSFLFFVGIVSLSLFALYLYRNPQLLNNPALLTFETLYNPTWLSFSFGCLLIALYNIKLNSSLVNVTARLSYPIYLLHIIFGGGVIPLQIFGGLLVPFRKTILIVLVFGISYLASLIIEYPFLRLYKTKKSLPIKPKSKNMIA